MRRLGIVFGFVATAGYGNVVGTDFQNFNPTSSGLDFVTVHSSETLKPGILNFGFFLNYAVNPLPEPEEEKSNERGALRNSILGGDFSLGLGLGDNWDVGISFPGTLNQDIKEETERFQFADKGLNEIRLNTKFRMFGDDSYGMALVASINYGLIGDNPYSGTDPGPTFNLELAADTTFGDVAVGGNLGYRWRQPGDALVDEEGEPLPGEPFHNQLLGSVAVAYLMKSIDSALIGEVYGSAAANDDSEEMQKLQDSAELLVGLRHYVDHNLALHFGGGTFLEKTTSSPDYRVYAGLHYTIGPLWQEEEPVFVKPKRKKIRKKPVKDIPETFDSGRGYSKETVVLKNLNFKSDSDKVILSGQLKYLDELAAYVKGLNDLRYVVVEGHTDSLGSDDYNQSLSKNRAETVRKSFITRYKFDPTKISSVGYGESRPIADNGNYQGRRRNRRVEFHIYRGN